MTERLDLFKEITAKKIPETDVSVLDDTVKHSIFLGDWLIKNTDKIQRILSYINLERGRDIIVNDIMSADALNMSEEEFLKHLRTHKMIEYTVIAASDLTLKKSVKDITEHISSFASAVLEAAFRYGMHVLKQKYGTPTDDEDNEVNMCVIGLGKLGGLELNFSSDVDIIYVYGTEKGRTKVEDGQKSIDNHVFFAKLAELITAYIGKRTEDGIVYRVDLRLRPDGDRGAIIMPIRSYEVYYESYGQSWERMMLLKARTVSGSEETGRAFIKAVKPFVFRKTLDYKLVDDLRSVKNKIDKRVELKGKNLKNVKLGYGGIREIEFIVQTYQILNYPKFNEVFHIRTLKGLDILSNLNMLSKEQTDRLTECYCFLRRLEHMAQIEEERQTHLVPEDSDTFDLYLERAGFANKDEFEKAYKEVTDYVNSQFNNLFKDDEKRADTTLLIFDEELSDEEASDVLKQMHCKTPMESTLILRRIVNGKSKNPRTPDVKKILISMLSQVVKKVVETRKPLEVLDKFERLLTKSSSVYLLHDIFSEMPDSVDKLAKIFTMSSYLSGLILSNTNMLEYLYDPKKMSFTTNDIYDEYNDIIKNINNDLEMELEKLRIKHNKMIFNVGNAYLNKKMNIINTMHSLTKLARGVTNLAFDKMYSQLSAQYGKPTTKDGKECEYIVVGMGKLGSNEMSFGSDLDLIFLFEENGVTDGAKSITNHEFFGKLVQKAISYLGSYTSNGFLYKIDMRLRPSGASGPLVTSITAFKDYQSKHAMFWEKQALLRSTVINKESTLTDEFFRIKHQCLFESCPVQGKDDAEYIFDMRMRIEKEKGSPPQKNDIKAGYGGIIDIEFAVQFLQLAHSCEHKELRTTNTHTALHRLRKMKILSSRDFNIMHKGYLFYRNLENLIRVYENSPTSILPSDESIRDKLASHFNFGGDPGETLFNEYQAERRSVRGAFNRIFDRYIKGE